MDPRVCVVQGDPVYPSSSQEPAGRPGWSALGQLMQLWGRDPANPFAGWVQPGGTVVLKPNWVMDRNPLEDGIESLVTHRAVVREVAELAAVALQGRGTIVIGDAPLQACDFARLRAANGVDTDVERLRERHPGLEVRVEDWRLTVIDRAGQDGFAAWQEQSTRDSAGPASPEGYRVLDLGKGSFLEDLASYSDRFRVTCYKPSLMRQHHAPGKHEYLVTDRVLSADLVINLPKMKTHIKAGLTGCLKNLVGINGHKEFLPHHIKGSYIEGGDCYGKPSLARRWYEDLADWFWEQEDLRGARRKFWSHALDWLWLAGHYAGAEASYGGSWSHNETIWRTTLDLNHVLYAGAEGARKVIHIVDGIVAGESEGPLSPEPKRAGLLVAGENPAYVDAVLARLMGYNVSRIPTVYQAIYHRRSRFAGPFLEDFVVDLATKGGPSRRLPFEELPDLRFRKPRFWRMADRTLG
ncbi:MAG: DUF362 domain-containing protein [Candidatus Wallbacteria bacterium]|nr:DUF362 domain-containing protein [Candidatus Wallbacteria bacterium]